MKYIEVKNIKNIEAIKVELEKMAPVFPKLFLNKKSLGFVLEVNETLLVWDKVIEVILDIDKNVIVKDEVKLDDARDLMPLTRTLEVISHRDITPWNPAKLVNN